MFNTHDGSHYSNAFDTDALQYDANEVVNKIISLWETKNIVPIIVYSGMSGISFATAIQLTIRNRNKKIPFYSLYVRKKGEKSHGKDVESSFHGIVLVESNKTYILFVDDLIESGKTFNFVLNKSLEYLLLIKCGYKINLEKNIYLALQKYHICGGDTNISKSELPFEVFFKIHVNDLKTNKKINNLIEKINCQNI